MSIDQSSIRNVIRTYCDNIRQTRRHPGHHPETSLYPHLEEVIGDIASILGYNVQIIQQYTQDQIGSPDFGLSRDGGVVSSFIEAKPPNESLSNFTGQNRVQFERYIRLPNLIYTNFWEFRLYQNGVPVMRAELAPPECLEPQQPQINQLLSAHDVGSAIQLLQRFFSFDLPYISSVRDLAYYLAQAAWLVRDAVIEAMEARPDDSPLYEIYHEFRDVLFYELEPREFADTYAQTLAYGLLLARQATQAELAMHNIASFVDSQHNRLLSATIRLLSQPQVVQIIGWTANNLVGVINSVSPNMLLPSADVTDPLLYFYEDFLEAYDPELRKRRGVYYTPSEVVNLQTRVINHLLVSNFGRRYGFADETVETLDPAVGTGTYLISALSRGCQRIEEAMGHDSIPDAASLMAKHLHGFEILVGPYTVAQFRLISAIHERGGRVNGQLPILLTNTLLPAEEQPDIQTQFGFMSGPLTEERRAADEVKNRVPIMVILGNPPYKRGRAEPGWMWDTLLESFRAPIRGEHSIDLKSLADPYVWFYRWAIWKLFEAETAPKQGILSFISNSRWILGGAFGGMRQVFRQYFDWVYIIDLHGDNRAPLPADVMEDQNIFEPVQVGVAVSICVADGSRGGQEAEVCYYGDTWGARESKYAWLDQITGDLANVHFQLVGGTGTDPFFPELGELFKSWPNLKNEVFLYSISGVQTKRDPLVIAPTSSKLREQIEAFINAPTSRKLEIFHETRDKTHNAAAQTNYDRRFDLRYGYRPLDIQHLYNHPDFVEYDRRRSLQAVWGTDNVALTTLPMGHGAGPVVFLHSYLPDICAFRGSYTSRVFPLWDNRQEDGEERGTEQSFLGRHHNLNPTMLVALQSIWGHGPTPEEVFAYCYAVLSAPSYSLNLSRDLARSFPRVPFPRTWESFQEGARLGHQLMDLHSFRNRYQADGSLRLHGTPEHIEFVEYNQDAHRVEFAPDAWVVPVTPGAWTYSVSGYEVLRHWMLRRRDVPFDMRIREELLDVVWIIERTVELSDELDDLLNRLIEGQTITNRELGLDSDA